MTLIDLAVYRRDGRSKSEKNGVKKKWIMSETIIKTGASEG